MLRRPMRLSVERWVFLFLFDMSQYINYFSAKIVSTRPSIHNVQSRLAPFSFSSRSAQLVAIEFFINSYRFDWVFMQLGFGYCIWRRSWGKVLFITTEHLLWRKKFCSASFNAAMSMAQRDQNFSRPTFDYASIRALFWSIIHYTKKACFLILMKI